jgi:ABC-type amino acid transport substrate-binding protein
MLRHILTILALICILSVTDPGHSSPLILTHSSSMPPLSFINDKGKPDGLLIDFWKEWAQQAEAEISFRLQPWGTSIDETVNGEADINAGMFYSSARAERMLFGDYIYHLQGGLFAAKGMTEEQLLDGHERFGVIKGDYSKIFMQERHPFTPLELFNTSREMFQAAANGRLKAFVADYPVALYQLNKFGVADKFQYVQELYTRDLHPTVSKNNHELVNKINQHMAAISKQRKLSILRKWLTIDNKEKSPGKVEGFAAGLILLICYLCRTRIMMVMNALQKKLKKTV